MSSFRMKYLSTFDVRVCVGPYLRDGVSGPPPRAIDLTRSNPRSCMALVSSADGLQNALCLAQ